MLKISEVVQILKLNSVIVAERTSKDQGQIKDFKKKGLGLESLMTITCRRIWGEEIQDVKWWILSHI